MLKEPPILKKFFVPQGLIPHGTTFKFDQVQEFEPKFENILGYEPRAHLGSIPEEKNQRPKISCYRTFNV